MDILNIGTVLLSCAALFSFSVAVRFPDWLVTDIKTPTKLQENGHTVTLTNGLISREFLLDADFTTIEFYSHEKQSSLLRAISPETIVALDDIQYNVGGFKTGIPRAYLNRTALFANMSIDEDAFHFRNFSTQNPVAPYPYTPVRGAPKDIVWPPKGLRLDVDFKAPFWAPIRHENIIVTVHYEMYDGIPLLVKWVSVSTSSVQQLSPVTVDVYSVEYLAVNQQWGSVSPHYGWMFVQTDQPHNTRVTWHTENTTKLPGGYMPVLNCSYELTASVPLDSSGYRSYRVFELVHGSHDAVRIALGKHRMVRMLAPQIQETPIFFHVTKTTSTAVKFVIDQMAEVGWEMIIFSFGSGFNIESNKEAYIEEVAELVRYANSKGIELGGYDLIALQRNVAGISKQYSAVNTDGSLQGNACFASKWYDFLTEHFFSFINKTGITMVETDGPYGGYPCSSTSHPYHRGLDDSIYKQNKLQQEFFMNLRRKNMFINQPDFYFFQGGSKTGLGYVEQQFSLPRWQDVSVSRQDITDDTYYLTNTQGWMFVPLVQYHGGGAAAMFEPLSEHKVEYEWALAQYMGAGLSTSYRGYRLYDSEETKAIVLKWTRFFKKYRDILSSDIIPVRRPDMQNIDAYLHVNPKLQNKGLVMVFNPTSSVRSMNLTLPLYFTGLTDRAIISEQGIKPTQYYLTRQYTVDVHVSLESLGITWFLIQ